MGFTPQQARLALASTDSGLDVQQALDTLLANGVGESFVEEHEPDVPRRRNAESRDEDAIRRENRKQGLRTRRPESQRQSSSSGQAEHPSSQTPSLLPEDMQERADKLLAQASEISLNVFNRANAFWRDGKEKVQKAYEERSAKGKAPTDGRPRWMTEAIDDDDESHKPGGGTTFRDDDEDEQPPRQPESGSKLPIKKAQSQPSAPTPAQRAANLFDDEPSTYVSPARRRPAANRTASQLEATPASMPRTPPKPVLRTRKTVPASESAIANSNIHKTKGTEFYKLGQYANADQEYSAALTVLPSSHLLLIPLYNNRAVARLKTGEHAAAAEDCTAVLSIIGSDYNPAHEAKVTRDDEGASVDLGDAFVKAYRRRAEAYEGREKWELALKDWEALVGCEWAVRTRTDALAGAGRCRKMVNGEKQPGLSLDLLNNFNLALILR